MTRTIAFGLLSVAMLLGGYRWLQVGSAAPQESRSSVHARGYEPMASLGDDPNLGGVSVEIGNGVKEANQPRAFLIDSDGTIEVAVQYQIKLPERYGPGGEVYRLVVQAIRPPSCCDGESKEVDYEFPYEPIAVFAGDHINTVIAAKVPFPAPAGRNAVRVLIEELQADGSWKPSAGKTLPIRFIQPVETADHDGR